jgi:hypothetical protein
MDVVLVLPAFPGKVHDCGSPAREFPSGDAGNQACRAVTTHCHFELSAIIGQAGRRSDTRVPWPSRLVISASPP